MQTLSFESVIEVGTTTMEFPTEYVKKEPQFFHSPLMYAWEKGGPITRAFLGEVLSSYPDLCNQDPILDSRVHMLMPSWYPCIPGWHHDNVERTGKNGQPNYQNPKTRPVHVMMLAGDPICRTEFAIGKFTLGMPEDGDLVYKHWHPQVEFSLECSSSGFDLLPGGRTWRVQVPMGKLIYFDDRSLHQGVPSTGTGWRWFGRVSFRSDIKEAPESDRIRTQTQVYMSSPFEGW